MLENENKMCWCGNDKLYVDCHKTFDEILDEYEKQGALVPTRDLIKNNSQIEGIRESGKINTAVLDYVEKNIKLGMTTEDINQLVHTKTIELGAIPAPLGYEGFTKSVCTSINNQVCHGIPSEDVFLNNGDIINVDVSTIYKGYFSDASRMFCIGNVSPKNEKLVHVAKKCVLLGLRAVKPWGFLGDVAEAIHTYARASGYSVVSDIGGHGIGLAFHEEPWVSYVAEKGTEMVMAPGMVFTIEPMINVGMADVFIDEKDGWTIYTVDKTFSAQWEVTVLVTDKGYKILSH